MTPAPAPKPHPLTLNDYAAGVVAADDVLVAARASVRQRVAAAKDDAEQAALHGLAWLATYVEAVRQLVAWAERLLIVLQLVNMAGRGWV